MFERFTEKAIKVITYSQEEAVGLNHSKLYPEHLLLGILKENTGIATRFLRVSGLNPELVKNKVNEIILNKENEIGLSTETLQFSSSVKNLFINSCEEAKILGANYVVPDHIFLTLIKSDTSSVVSIFNEFGIDLDRIKSSVRRLVENKAKKKAHPECVPKSSSLLPQCFSMGSIFEEVESSQLMNSALDKLKHTNYETLGTEQILLAILENSESGLFTLLENEGVTAQEFIKRLGFLNSREEEYNAGEYQFTPKAFEAIGSGYEIAKELGSANVKPEHLLLGLLKNKKGIACRILKDMNVDTDYLYNKILKPIEKQKPVTLTIIRLAQEEARRLGHSVVGTEQILLGILGEGTGIGSRVLKELGITLKDTRIEVEKIVGFGSDNSEKDAALTPRAKKLLEIAWEKAKQFGNSRIESEHLLLAITKVEDSVAMKILSALGVDVIEIKQGILRAIQEKNKD